MKEKGKRNNFNAHVTHNACTRIEEKGSKATRGE
jgi:hypothetical protein